MTDSSKEYIHLLNRSRKAKADLRNVVDVYNDLARDLNEKELEVTEKIPLENIATETHSVDGKVYFYAIVLHLKVHSKELVWYQDIQLNK